MTATKPATPRSRTDLTLSRLERASDLWQRLTKHWDGRLESLRLELEKPITPEATASLRGRIALLREIQALGTGPVRALADEQSPGEE